MEYSSNIYSALYLTIATSTIFTNITNLEDPLIRDIMKMIKELNGLELKTKDNEMLLHLCLNHLTKKDTIYMTENCM